MSARTSIGFRLIWSFITACGFLTACGITDLSAGTPFPGNPSHTCNTGTTLALVVPLPGNTSVPAQTRTIIIASSPGIRVAHVALVVVSTQGAPGSKGPRLLFGPIPAPTSTPLPPSPFPSPVFYAATGFRLRADRAYGVDVAILGSNCTRGPINGAIFRTAKNMLSRDVRPHLHTRPFVGAMP